MWSEPEKGLRFYLYPTDGTTKPPVAPSAGLSQHEVKLQNMEAVPAPSRQQTDSLGAL